LPQLFPSLSVAPERPLQWRLFVVMYSIPKEQYYGWFQKEGKNIYWLFSFAHIPKLLRKYWSMQLSKILD
jgi:hypothetical protein